MTSIGIIGAGVFGLTAGIELARRGHDVTIYEQSTVPNPLSSSFDVSRAVRADYGDDEYYIDLARICIERWRQWNEISQQTLFHETGFLFLTSKPLEKTDFEFSSYLQLKKRHVAVKKLSAADFRDSYAKWASSDYQNGYYNPEAGWAAANLVMYFLVSTAAKLSVTVESSRKVKVVEASSDSASITLDNGQTISYDLAILACGAWSQLIIRNAADIFDIVGQPIFCVGKPEGVSFSERLFPPWTADVNFTGWYGFPDLGEGILKFANHGPAIPMSANQDRSVPTEWTEKFRLFWPTNYQSWLIVS